MKIQEVSEMFELTQDTLRYYEKIGLLDKIQKDKSGRRDYQESDLQRLEFVKCMRMAGLSIQLLQKYLNLLEKGEETLEERMNVLIQAKNELLKQQDHIQSSLKRLDYKIEHCREKLKVLMNKDSLFRHETFFHFLLLLWLDYIGKTSVIIMMFYGG